MRTARAGIGLLIVAIAAVGVAGFSVQVPGAGAADDSLCTSAKELADLHATSEARQAYAQLLVQHPGLECARIGLGGITTPVPADAVAEAQNLCDRGDVYADRGLDADAKKAYDAALAKDVDAQCAADGLTPPWWSRAADWVKEVLPDLLLVAGGVVVAALLIALLGYLPPVGYLYSRLWLVRVWLRPRLSLSSLDDTSLGDSKVGAAMTARIRQLLQRFREEALEEDNEGYFLDVSSSDQPLVDIVAGDGQLRSTITKLGEASDQGKILAAIVDAVITALPIKRLALAGVLEPAQAKVPAATLMLTEGPRLAGTVALDTPPLPSDPTSADYLRLCDAAAVWVQYEVARQLRGDKVDRDLADSYAFVRAGLDLLRAGQVADAMSAFTRAIAVQPDNWSAHVNLLTVLLRYTESASLARRIKRTMVDMERAGGPW